jgi:hypothetical protein
MDRQLARHVGVAGSLNITCRRYKDNAVFHNSTILSNDFVKRDTYPIITAVNTAYYCIYEV